MSNRTAATARSPVLTFLWGALLVCAFPLVLATIGNLLLALSDQAREFLIELDRGLGGDGESLTTVRKFATMEAAIFLWGLAVWYTCRLLLGFDGHGLIELPRPDDPACARRIDFIRRWLPRVAGGLCIALIPLWYWLPVRPAGAASPLRALELAIPLPLFLFFVIGRRPLMRWLEKRDRRALMGSADYQFPRIAAVTWAVLGTAILASFVLLAWIVRHPERAGAIGAPALLFLAMSSWVLFGAIVLTLLPRSLGLPSLMLLPALLLLFASFFNDNHRLRRSAMSVDGQQQTDFDRYAADWLAARAPDAGAAPYPVLVIASAGGGIRAAYWTARVLGGLDDRTGGWFGRHVFAISGVSGGSLGAAAYVAALADHPHGGGDCLPPGSPLSPRLTQFLSRDYLSPVVGAMLFPDSFQRFVPWPFAELDRARAMELSWERRWRQSFGCAADRFAAPYVDLYAAHPTALPQLFLNSTTVDEGKRVVQSALKLPADVGPLDGVELLSAPQLDVTAMPLSTAVHNSARFPYVSPAGTVPSAMPGKVWGRLVDGGYFDNSGATTAREIIDALKRAPSAAGMDLYALQITNDTEAPALCSADGTINMQTAIHAPTGRVPVDSELTTPLAAIMSSREGRSTFSQLQLMQAADRSQTSDRHCGSRFWTAYPQNAPHEPPLGWYLSPTTRRAFDAVADQAVCALILRLQAFPGWQAAWRCPG